MRGTEPSSPLGPWDKDWRAPDDSFPRGSPPPPEAGAESRWRRRLRLSLRLMFVVQLVSTAIFAAFVFKLMLGR
jgi:hypothetical protein